MIHLLDFLLISSRDLIKTKISQMVTIAMSHLILAVLNQIILNPWLMGLLTVVLHLVGKTPSVSILRNVSKAYVALPYLVNINLSFSVYLSVYFLFTVSIFIRLIFHKSRNAMNNGVYDEWNWEEEVVVVTGGMYRNTSPLGGLNTLSKVFSRRWRDWGRTCSEIGCSRITCGSFRHFTLDIQIP